MAVYYDEKQKTWYCKFRYTDWQGNSVSTSKRGFARKKDAITYEVNFKANANNPPKPSITINELAIDFLEDNKLHTKKSSYVATETNIRKHVLPYVGNVKLEKFTIATARKWQNEIMKKGFTPSTQRAINISFNTMLNYAVKYKGMANNPFKAIGKVGIQEKRLVFIIPAEWNKITSYITNIIDKTFLDILYWSGIRVGELMALNFDKINYDTKVMTINAGYTRQNGFSTPKTRASIRNITLPNFVISEVKLLENSCLDIPEYFIELTDEMKLSRHLKKYVKQAKIDKSVSIHALRHSHASFLIKQNVPLTDISRRLGHSSPAVTLRTYAHCFEKQDNAIANMLDNFVGQM